MCCRARECRQTNCQTHLIETLAQQSAPLPKHTGSGAVLQDRSNLDTVMDFALVPSGD